MSAPNYYALRYKLQLGQFVNDTRAHYQKAGRPRPEFTHWLGSPGLAVRRQRKDIAQLGFLGRQA